jgi:hypothetical protein
LITAVDTKTKNKNKFLFLEFEIWTVFFFPSVKKKLSVMLTKYKISVSIISLINSKNVLFLPFTCKLVNF